MGLPPRFFIKFPHLTLDYFTRPSFTPAWLLLQLTTTIHYQTFLVNGIVL